MLVDGFTLTATGTADNFRIMEGTTLPSTPSNGLVFRLTAIEGSLHPGIYYWASDSSEWIPFDSKAIAGAGSGVATLDAQLKIIQEQLPNIAITDTFVVATEAAMLGLTAQVGDVAVRTDLGTTYILAVDGASVLANWQVLLAPQDPQGTPYDIATAYNGKPEAATVILRFTAVRAFALRTNMAGSYLKAATGATASAAFTFQKNGSTFCTAAFAAGSSSSSFGSCAAPTFAIGDVLTIVAPLTPDSSLADIYLSLAGTAE